MEYNDIYDSRRRLTGRVHLRGTPWEKGEYGMVVCVWVYDGYGKILLTQRAPGKIAEGTWENSGGAVQAGESSLTAIQRELFEETGILAEPSEFRLIEQNTHDRIHYDHYALKKSVPIENIVLQPGETVDARWTDFSEIHRLIDADQMCRVIGNQFLSMEAILKELSECIKKHT